MSDLVLSGGIVQTDRETHMITTVSVQWVSWNLWHPGRELTVVARNGNYEL